MKRFSLLLLLFAPVLALPGCTLGPDYVRPEAPIPSTYKNAGPWQPAAPKDDLPRGAWWEVYGDPALNDLETRAAAANQQVQGALARVAQARAVARVSQGDLYPRLDLNPSARRSRITLQQFGSSQGLMISLFRVPLDLSWEVDLWGRIRRSVEASGADAEASLDDYHSLLLTVQAEVARLYFALRAFDAEIALLDRTVALREENLRLVTSRFRGGETSRLDVNRAETELATTRSDALSLRKRRAEIENALAVLVGAPASGFSLAARPLDLQPPAVAAGVPATLLERRPDIARAERRMAAANARIGVAKTAFFPAVRLTGSAGFESREASLLFDSGSRVWALGPSVSLPVFEGGRNRANLNRARAVWDEAVADYRQQVLAAFQEVEDGLSGLGFLAEQAERQREAVEAARRAADLSGKRYKAGLVSYLEVVDAERTALQSERVAVQLLGERLQTSVFLIKALGGGWREEDALTRPSGTLSRGERDLAEG